jgi:hypothetical protein
MLRKIRITLLPLHHGKMITILRVQHFLYVAFDFTGKMLPDNLQEVRSCDEIKITYIATPASITDIFE